MKSQKYLFLLLQILLLTSVAASAQENMPDKTTARTMNEFYLGQTPPGNAPERFAAQVIGNHFYPHSRLMTSPQGERIYWSTFLDTVNRGYALYSAGFDGQYLSTPEKDSTFKKYNINSFSFADDGKKILFGARRPCGKFNGEKVHAVWYCQKTAAGWVEPQPIESTIDTAWASVGAVSINKAGDIYFVGRMKGKRAKIYCSKCIKGAYQKYEPLPENVNTGITLDPFIDYQDRYLLFAAARRRENIGIMDLYISFRNENGTWEKAINLGPNICSRFMDRFPMVTKDGKYLFFVTSNSNHFPSTYTHYYWVSTNFIAALKPGNN